MIFVDTNVFMYAVGKTHPLKSRAREFFAASVINEESLCTSAEVLQELLHAYLPVRRSDVLEDALSLIDRTGAEVWPLEKEDVVLARQLHSAHPALRARDLCHLASCRRRGVHQIMTFDQALVDASALRMAREPE